MKNLNVSVKKSKGSLTTRLGPNYVSTWPGSDAIKITLTSRHS